jgi:hypothetical protein
MTAALMDGAIAACIKHGDDLADCEDLRGEQVCTEGLTDVDASARPRS